MSRRICLVAPLPAHTGLAEHAAADPAATAETHRQLSESRALLAAEIADRTQAETSRARLLRRLVVAQEDERRRLAQDLHDGLGQRLTALRLTLEALDGDRSAPTSGNRERPGDAGAVSIRTSTSLPGSSDLRRWTNLDWPGCSRPMSKSGPATPASQPCSTRDQAICSDLLLKWRQASTVSPRRRLNNVAKHARARSANVLLELRGENLALVIEDDGVGFQPTAKGETMIGLTGMRERALAVGGTVELEPTPGGGTTVLACIPTTGGRREHSRTAGDTGDVTDSDFAHADRGDSIEASGPALTAIRTRLQELQRAVGARDEFIATVAHELRNPIAPLTFQVRLALNKAEQLAAAGTPVSVEWIQTQLRGVEQRLHRLLETLDRLLDVSRLSTGRIDLQAEPMNLAEVVREVIDGFEAELAVARCKLTLSARGMPTGSWDRLRVEQVFRNLLSNAIRFGAGRPIEVAVDADHDFASVYDSRPWHRHCAGSAVEDLRALRARGPSSVVAASASGSGLCGTSASRWAARCRLRVRSVRGRVSR